MPWIWPCWMKIATELPPRSPQRRQRSSVLSAPGASDAPAHAAQNTCGQRMYATNSPICVLHDGVLRWRWKIGIERNVLA